MHTQSKKGFTLIELLVVIAIIGILASVVIVSLNTARAKARDSGRISDVQAMGTAFSTYTIDQTPDQSPTAVTTGLLAGWDTSMPDLTAGTPPLSKYLGTLPTDSTANTFTYVNAGSDVSYCLGTHLEQTAGSFICNSAGCAASSTVASTLTGSAFNAWGATCAEL